MFQGINVHAELASNIDINVDQDDLLDIVLTLGKTDSTIDTFEADLIAALVNKGVPQDKIKIQAVESSEVSAGNTSEGWEIYDHTNYTTNVINYYRPYYSETNGNYVLYNHIVPTITTSTNIDFYGYGQNMDAFRATYAEWGAWIILIKGLTPIPFKLVTIASGFAGYDFWLFVLLSIITRGIRFFLVAGLLHIYGEPIRNFLERRLELVTAGFAAVIVSGFVIVRYVV
jgi:hypothetical protein